MKANGVSILKEEVIEFWENLYKEGKMPWDFGGVPSHVTKFAYGLEAPKKILIPGCGSAWEAGFLAEEGFDVRAIDISEEAIKRASQVLGKNDKIILEVVDFFELTDNEFDFIYERAFLCSFNPTLREAYVKKMSELLKRDGSVFGYFFVDEERESGPPFPIEEKRLFELMDREFILKEDESTLDGLDVFDGKERWQVWRKK